LNFLFIKLFLKSVSNQHIRMISEGSCDTKDWTNGYILYTLNETEVNRSH